VIHGSDSKDDLICVKSKCMFEHTIFMVHTYLYMCSYIYIHLCIEIRVYLFVHCNGRGGPRIAKRKVCGGGFNKNTSFGCFLLLEW